MKPKSRQHSIIFKIIFRTDNHFNSIVTSIKFKCRLLAKGRNGSGPLCAHPTCLTSNTTPGMLKCSCNWAVSQSNEHNRHGWKFKFFDLLFSQISSSTHCGATQALQRKNEIVTCDSSLHLMTKRNVQQNMAFHILLPMDTSGSPMLDELLSFCSSRQPHAKPHSPTLSPPIKANCPELVTST